tara:strand:- start:5383 stop:5991 length:609 start_codon:yes stop_codon:yes gene_type:complete
MEAPPAYPLAWPTGKPRTPTAQRKNGKFSHRGQDLTVAVAASRVEDELTKLGARWPAISSNVELTLSGRPRSGQREPEDRGVCVYFEMGGKPYAMACDRYTTVADNLAAIAAHVDATRAIERHGVATAAETLQALQALPAPGGGHWTATLGLTRAATPDAVKAAHRRLLAGAHPDQGGSHDRMADLNAARDAALKDIAEAGA